MTLTLQDISRRKAIVTVLLCSLLAVWPLFLPTCYKTHDVFSHLPKLAQFIVALRDGQFPVRWLPDIMGGYGLPVFVVLPPLSYYVSSLFNLLGFGLFASYNGFYILSIPLSGIAMYFFAEEFFERKAAVLSAVIYMLAPYRFVDIYVRGAFNESATFIFIPVIFLGIKRAAEGRLTGIPLLSLALAGLALSHSVITVFMIPWILLYGLVATGGLKRMGGLTRVVPGIALGFGLALFYLMPAFLEKSYTRIDRSALEGYFRFDRHFIDFAQMVSPVWGYAASSGTTPMPLQIGSLPLLFLIISLIGVRYVHDREMKINVLFFQGMAIFSIFMMVKWSTPLWEAVPILQFSQFPWRFLNVIVFPTAFLAGALWVFLRERARWTKAVNLCVLLAPSIVLLLFLLLQVTFSFNTFVLIELILFGAGAGLLWILGRGKADEAEVLFRNSLFMILLLSLCMSAVPLHATLLGEPHAIEDPAKFESSLQPEGFRKSMRLGIGGLAFLPKSVVSMPAPRKSKIETISGDMSVVSLSERSNAVTFSIEAVSDSEFLVNTFSFPGWQAYRDGVKTEFTADIAGRMLFTVPRGRHTFEVRFEDTPVRFTAEMLSVLSLAALAAIIVYSLWQKRKKAAASG